MLTANNSVEVFKSRGLERLTTRYAADLAAVPWFSNCGAPFNVDIFPGIHVKNLAAAIAATDNDDAIRIRNAAANDLRTFLHTRHNAIYQIWNEAVAAADPIMAPYAEIQRQFCEKNGFNDWCNTIFRADLIDYGIWVFYSELEGIPKSPAYAFEFYKRGRLPCAWSRDVADRPAGDFLYW